MATNVADLWEVMTQSERTEIMRLVSQLKPDVCNLGFWTPYDGPQTDFLQSQVFEVLFGGAAGPGKTDCLLISQLEQIHHPRFNGIIFRRTLEDLKKADGLIERSKLYYPHMGGQYNIVDKRWTFPSGAKIYFGGLERKDDVFKYQSAQFQEIGFDELTHFLKTQFLYMFSRCREPYHNSGLRLKIRAASNPGGPGHDFVKERFVTTDIVNKPRWFARIDDVDTEVDGNHPLARQRQFIPASHGDNPSLDKNYILNLNQLDRVERLQLLNGDWDAMYTEGLVYDNWSNEHNITSNADYNSDLEVMWSIDDGYNPNPRGVLLVQEWPDGTLRVFDEYYETGQLHEETVEYLLSLQYNRPTVCYYDPSAPLMAQVFANHGLYMVASNNNLSEGIKGVRREICDGRGVRQLLVHPRCKNLIHEITNYRYHETMRLPNGDPRPIKDNDHLNDSLRYLIATHRMWRYEQ